MAPPGLWRCAHHSNYDTPSSTQYDRTTKRCKHSFPAPNSNNLAIATQRSRYFFKQIFVCFKNDIIVTTVHHTNDARSATSAAQLAVAYACDAASSFSSGLSNALLQCSDPNGAEHEQPPALRPILQPRHTAIFLQ